MNRRGFLTLFGATALTPIIPNVLKDALDVPELSNFQENIDVPFYTSTSFKVPSDLQPNRVYFFRTRYSVPEVVQPNLIKKLFGYKPTVVSQWQEWSEPVKFEIWSSEGNELA